MCRLWRSLCHESPSRASQRLCTYLHVHNVGLGLTWDCPSAKQLGTQVENGKQGYIADTLSAPAIPSITTLAIVHGCSQMVWQWQFDGIGSGAFRVRGMTLITVDNSSQVVEQYVEFNSLAWAIDIGFNVTPPAGGVAR